MLTHYHFNRGERRYRAKRSREGVSPARGHPCSVWLVTIDDGPEYQACEARFDDEPGPELEDRLVAARPQEVAPEKIRDAG
jgi:hypothetical protein